MRWTCKQLRRIGEHHVGDESRGHCQRKKLQIRGGENDWAVGLASDHSEFMVFHVSLQPERDRNERRRVYTCTSVCIF